MSGSAATAALARYNKDRAQQKKNAVRAALGELLEDARQPITKSNVARRARVSREFIHSHPELGQMIEAASRARIAPAHEHGGGKTLQGLQAQNQTFARKIAQQKTVITQLRETITELRRQRELQLGAQLAAVTVDPDIHSRLQLDHDRLAAEKATLKRRLAEKQQQVEVLQEDLAASRQAHIDDVAQLSPGSVSPIR
ncbi:DUF6262 family protein [Nocardia sp. CA-135398]|uniref:DUF6262 family protein n=1 Tax=Nocardia sp. CA-135398 TaxID=3239977 RepID=UPI003D9756E2